MSKQRAIRIWQTKCFVGTILMLAAAAAIGSAALAKKKEKAPLPELVVKAHSVAILILPGTREAMADPVGNRRAQEDVEKAFLKWGRYQLMQEVFTADLVIGIRKGTGTAGSPTVGGSIPDTRPGTIETTDNAIHIGVQKGQPPSSEPQPGGAPASETSGAQGGGAEDVIEVFLGGDGYDANNAPLWVYRKMDGFKPPAMSAVEQFRKAVEETEKAMAQKQKQQEKQKNP